LHYCSVIVVVCRSRTVSMHDVDNHNIVKSACQWSSQVLKSGWAQGVCGTEVPQWGPGAEPRWESGGDWAKPPEARCIQTVCSVKCSSTQVCCRVRPPSSLSQKTLRICTNPMTQHGRRRVGTCPLVPTRGYATGAYHKESGKCHGISSAWTVATLFVLDRRLA